METHRLLRLSLRVAVVLGTSVRRERRKGPAVEARRSVIDRRKPFGGMGKPVDEDRFSDHFPSVTRQRGSVPRTAGSGLRLLLHSGKLRRSGSLGAGRPDGPESITRETRSAKGVVGGDADRPWS